MDIEYFVRVRIVPYALGAVTFAQNLFDHVLRDANVSSSRADTETPTSFAGKVCVITGANAGIGHATAAGLIRRGASVILACRSLSKAQEAAKVLEALQPMHGCQRGSCQIRQLDLSSLASVQKFTEQFAAQQLHADVLICNAGIMAPAARGVTEDGLEQQFQVNYLGHWRLVHALVSRHLQAAGTKAHKAHPQYQQPGSKAMRIIWLTSMTHIGAQLDWEDLQLVRRYSGFLGYANSKLAAILATKEYQRRVDRNTVTADHSAASFCAVHPGFVDTQLANGWLTGHDVVPAAIQRAIQPAVRLICPWILAPPQQAVQTMLYAASAPAHEVSGQYIAKGKVAKPSKQAANAHLAQRLWQVSCELTGVEAAACFA